MSTSREQIDRLLALVPYLQRRGEVSVAEAARQFGVDDHILLRDLNVLAFCGLPGLGMGDLIDFDFEALEGEKVIRIRDAEFLTRPLRLGNLEAAALLAALQALRETSGTATGSAGVVQSGVVERTIAKIRDAVGSAPQIEVHPTVPEATEQVAADRLASAIASRVQVRIAHAPAVRDEVVERVVDPIAVTEAQGHRYLDAWCHLAVGRRLFRLDRIADVVVLDTPVTTEEDPLDLAGGAFVGGPLASVATLRLSPGARWVAEYFPVDECVEEGDGDLRVTLPVGDADWLARLMLRLGGAAELVAPAELRTRVTALAQRALDNYS